MDKIRVLSGIRASQSGLHLGNLLGAVEGMVKLQNDSRYETFYMIADLHGITTPYKPSELKKDRLEIAKDFLAAGIDPKKSALFLQSDVSEHAEFAFYLSSVVSYYRLNHLPSYKDKIKQYPQHNTVALFNYPVLMAADILLYKAKEVPLGADQVYHLEVTREIARKMNADYGTDFPEPERYVISGNELTMPDLMEDEGPKSKKMSKSEPDGTIFLNDTLDTIKRKVAKIPTQVAGGELLPKKGGIHTLYLLTRLFIPMKADQFEREYINGTIRYGDKKKELSQAIFARLEPIQEKRKMFDKNPNLVIDILKEGAKRAHAVANITLQETKEKMGLA